MADQSALRQEEQVEEQTNELVFRVIRGMGASKTPLNRLIHERVRLGIISALAVSPSLTFNELKEILETSDGNLSVHARKLEEAEYIKCIKYFDGRVPKTEYRITDLGRNTLKSYLQHMETLVEAMKS